jgi:tetratricopeptide (TPR) repeat protein
MRLCHAAPLLVFGIVTAKPVAAQHDHAGSAAADSAIALFDNLGPHTRTITTASPLAQRYFNQGLNLGFGFGMPEARRSFEAALRADPTCAMCAWGLAWSLGPYVNGGRDSARDVRAHGLVRQALDAARSSGATPVERALIEAMATRYPAEPTAARQIAADSAYTRSMREVHRRFPDDLDAAALFAESIMVLRPWDYWTRAGTPQPGIAELLQVLESVLARHLRHPGACHLYIHAVEASTAPERAETCADLLIDGMPGASHMRHMPSHTYVRIGRYGDAVRANQLAWIADQQAAYGGATAIYPSHNLHMLLFAASYDGQSGVALQAARDLQRLGSGNAAFNALVLARFGRWAELLDMSAPSDRLAQAMWHYARGMAELRTREAVSARMNLAALDVVAADADLPASVRHLVGIARATLSAEIDAGAGRYDGAVRTLEAARVIETDSLGYDEPEPWLIPLRQTLGAILLEANRPVEAETAYRGELATHPENGWSLYGLARALQAQGREEEAEQVRQRHRRAWIRADVDIRASRF